MHIIGFAVLYYGIIGLIDFITFSLFNTFCCGSKPTFVLLYMLSVSSMCFLRSMSKYSNTWKLHFNFTYQNLSSIKLFCIIAHILEWKKILTKYSFWSAWTTSRRLTTFGCSSSYQNYIQLFEMINLLLKHWEKKHVCCIEILKCTFSRDISRIAVEGTPSDSVSSRIFFKATTCSVILSVALYTIPYVPSPIFSILWKFSILEPCSV